MALLMYLNKVRSLTTEIERSASNLFDSLIFLTGEVPTRKPSRLWHTLERRCVYEVSRGFIKSFSLFNDRTQTEVTSSKCSFVLSTAALWIWFLPLSNVPQPRRWLLAKSSITVSGRCDWSFFLTWNFVESFHRNNLFSKRFLNIFNYLQTAFQRRHINRGQRDRWSGQ